MELETLEFALVSASLALREDTLSDDPRDLNFRLQLTSEDEVLDQEGQLFRNIPWYLHVTAKHEGDLIDLDEDNIGTLKYTSHRHHWCSARICLSPLKFQSLLESLLHGKVLSQVTLGVRGLRKAEQGLMWPKAEAAELPIEEAEFTVNLFS